jgi:hypothetical protein
MKGDYSLILWTYWVEAGTLGTPNGGLPLRHHPDRNRYILVMSPEPRAQVVAGLAGPRSFLARSIIKATVN